MWYVKPKDELYHHGIKGQKWGVRRFQNEDGTLTADGRKRYGRVVGTNGSVSIFEKKGRSGGFYEILNGNKKIGNAIVDEYDDHSHLDWIGIKQKERRKGYGKKALEIILNDAIKKGKKYITLEAAGLDPAAEHVYSKAGFKAVKNIDDEIWNGLLIMRKDL